MSSRAKPWITPAMWRKAKNVMKHRWAAPLVVAVVLCGKEVYLCSPYAFLTKLVEAQKIEGERKLPQKLKDLVVQEVELSSDAGPKEKEGLVSRFYLSKSLNPAVPSHTKASAVPIPAGFFFENLTEAKAWLSNDSKFGSKSTETVEKLANSSVLSTNAKRFYIQRQLQLKKVTLGYTTYDFLIVYFSAAGIIQLDEILRNLIQRRGSVPTVLRLSVVMTLLAGYAYARSSVYRRANLKADRQTSLKEDFYVSAGIEYYEKLLGHNKILRESDRKFRKRYSEDGDCNSTWRTFNLWGIPESSLVERLAGINAMQEST